MANLTESEIAVDQAPCGWRLDNTYARLPDCLFAPAKAAKVPAPRLVIFNQKLAEDLGLNLSQIPADAVASLFAGQVLPDGFQPIAQAYAGHQYGGFTMLGDGRAILLGEQCSPRGRFDIQLKGAGQTPYSRRGDGRAALGPMLREYIISEAMFALGIPTTRSLAVVTTGERVYRQSPLQGAILTRVAASHIRVGTFQYLAARDDVENLRVLADYTIERHYPELVDSANRYVDFFRAVMDRQAALIARWQLVGFVHGVMNTDNVAISGETIDYGPCAFMNSFDPATVFSSIDHGGRYAYGNQPAIAQWNLARFAETQLPLIAPQQEDAIAIATDLLGQFPDLFEGYWLEGMRAKLGLQTTEAGDRELAESLLKWMQKTKADFTNTFRDLSTDEAMTEECYKSPEFQSWHSRWQLRLNQQSRTASASRTAMRSSNPVVIPRNHRVEEALAAAENGDLSVLHRLLAVLTKPYESSADSAEYQIPSDDCHYQTFCGT
ncbi:MAG: YdiU family protein [Planctomycetaceae bacterium]